MICAACHHQSLPGGVRCLYCGEHFPVAPDFDIAAMQSASAGAARAATATPTSAPIPGRKAGWIGTLTVLALKGKSLLILLKFGKIATTFASMFAFIAAESLLFGWKMAAGIGICIFVHEMGHVTVNWRKGLKQSAPMFIPFLGAVIFVKRFPDDPTVQAECGAGGPAAGAIAALICLAIGMAFGSPFWLVLANIGFLINLFNMIPFPPLDGAHMCSVFSPRIWNGILVALLLIVIKAPSMPIVMVLVVNVLFRLGRADAGRHLLASPLVRLRMASLYVVLSVVLAGGIQISGEAFARMPISARVSVLSTRRMRGARRRPSSAIALRPVGRGAQGDERLAQQSVRVWAARYVHRPYFYIPAILWLLTVGLLSLATRQRLTFRRFDIALLIIGTAAAISLGTMLAHAMVATAVRIHLVYIAASFVAVGFAAVQAVRSSKQPRKGYFSLLGCCMGWAASAALILAYAMSSLAIVAAVAVFAAAFYARYPWALPSLAARLAEQAGDLDRSLAWRRKALGLKPDIESEVELLSGVARLSAALSQGGPTLAALESRDRLVAEQLTPRSAPETTTADTLDLRGSALGLLNRPMEALQCYEEVLRKPGADARTLLLVRGRLAELARLRGWPDETIAQLNVCLNGATRLPRSLLAYLLALRAAALAEQGDIEGARAEAVRALAASREGPVNVRVALTRALCALRANDPDTADKETARASRLYPGSLEVRYWRGRALQSGEHKSDGDDALQALAAQFPAEHWGEEARRALGPTDSAYAVAAPARQTGGSEFDL